jgi:hypothetical protein
MEWERTENRLALDPLVAHPDADRDSFGGPRFFLYWGSLVLSSWVRRFVLSLVPSVLRFFASSGAGGLAP